MKMNQFSNGMLFVLMALLSVQAEAETVVVSVPGPGTLSYLPVYMAKAIAADQAEGLDLQLRYVAGGPLALRDLREKNSDFAVAGLPAIADARTTGMPVVAIGQLSQSAMYVFLLREGLRKQVRNISQLKGKRIGTTSNATRTRSMGFMMTEYLINKSGIKPGEVQFIAVGQNRDTQRAALSSEAVDAIMGDEPFASELVEQGGAVRLADLYLPKTSGELLGGPIVHAALATRDEVLQQHPDTVSKVLRMYERTLQWMARHTASEIVEKLGNQPGFPTEEGKLLAKILKRNQGMYPDTARWNNRAVAVTEKFFHDTADDQQDKALDFSSFVVSPKSVSSTVTETPK